LLSLLESEGHGPGGRQSSPAQLVAPATCRTGRSQKGTHRAPRLPPAVHPSYPRRCSARDSQGQARRSFQRTGQLPSFLPQGLATGAPALRATGTNGRDASASVDSAYTALTPKSDSECVSRRFLETGTADALRRRPSASPVGLKGLRADEIDCDGLREEAPPGFEPGMADLQSAALPLGEGAFHLWHVSERLS
jgi:hypothetical protein